MRRPSLPAVLALCGSVTGLAAQAHPAPTTTKVADGVYLFRTEPYSDVGLDGNAVAVIGGDGVLVLDGNGTPEAARHVIAGIRTLTRLPVRYLVISHWHWDHWYGNEAYRAAFPGVTIIAHAATRAMMLGPALAFNRPGLESQLPGHIEAVAAARAEARQQGDTGRVARLTRHLAADRAFLEAKRRVRHTPASLTFTDSLTLFLGGREVRILHLERAVTPGDAFIHLPADRMVLTGDLLVNPISYALGAYPTGWLRTLEGIAALRPAILVPGHGAPLHDTGLLEAHIALFREMLTRGRAARERGLDPDQARAEMLPGLADLEARITGGDSTLHQQFETYLVDWYLHRVWDELAGPLPDAVPTFPEHRE